MNVVGCVGWSPELRQALVSNFESAMRPFGWLDVSRHEWPSTSILGAVNAKARVVVQQSGGVSRFYVGTGRPAADEELLPEQSAHIFGQHRSGDEGELYLSYAGRLDGTCCISVDCLGLFPLYYYATSQFLLFSSSVWPFGRHPLISEELDPDGLIGILLSQGVVGGRTLLKGVARLSAGMALSWAPGRAASEHAFNRLCPTPDLHRRSFRDQIDAVDSALRSAVRRCDADTVLLSGGLDSRLLAGYAHEIRGAGAAAVSLGSSGQFDVEFARQVAQQLGWRHRSIDVDMSQFAQHARMQVRHEQLTGSFWDLSFWQVATDLHEGDPTILTGFCGNNVLEPLRHDPRQTTFTFDGVFRSCNKYGFRPEALPALLRVDRIEERTAAVIEQLRREYESYDGEPFQKVLMFDLTHRARFLVGMVAWRLSWGTRPRLAYADRSVLTVSLGLPVEAFRDRKLQRALLRHRFPDLARLPLDTASFFTRPLMPSFADRVRHLGLLCYHGLVSRRERRYYHSVFDLNGAGWRSVRVEAENARSKVDAVFARGELLRQLPPPQTHIKTNVADFFQEGSRKKSLLAFLLWASDHL